jgi:hypothetical protein
MMYMRRWEPVGVAVGIEAKCFRKSWAHLNSVLVNVGASDADASRRTTRALLSVNGFFSLFGSCFFKLGFELLSSRM